MREVEGSTLSRLARRVEKQFESSPLEFLGAKLLALIHGVACATGPTAPKDAKAVINYITTLLRVLPADFGDRFVFDSLLIQSIAAEWNARIGLLSNMILPSYGRAEWGHFAFPMPTEDGSQAHVVDIIFFPGGTSTTGVELNDYVLLVHELVHCLLRRFGRTFLQPFETELDALVRRLRLRSIIDSPVAKQRGEQRIDALLRHWRPTSNQQNWAYELAADAISLWGLGPSYVARIAREISSEDLNPYLVESAYPPYALRLMALQLGCARLGWPDTKEELVVLLNACERSKWKVALNNHFRFVTDAELIDACVDRAISFASEAGVPQCTPASFAHLSQEIGRGSTAPPGMQLILTAASQISDRTHNYVAWEESVIRTLIGSDGDSAEIVSA